MITERKRAARWRRNLKAREARKSVAQRCRAFASRFVVRGPGDPHRPVWRTKQWTVPGYVKPNVKRRAA